jgi:hypothetical protein
VAATQGTPPHPARRQDQRVSGSYDVVVTWMDGQKETYFATGQPKIQDGELVITEEYGITGGTHHQYRIPQANIRVWKAEAR